MKIDVHTILICWVELHIMSDSLERLDFTVDWRRFKIMMVYFFIYYRPGIKRTMRDMHGSETLPGF